MTFERHIEETLAAGIPSRVSGATVICARSPAASGAVRTEGGADCVVTVAASGRVHDSPTLPGVTVQVAVTVARSVGGDASGALDADLDAILDGWLEDAHLGRASSTLLSSLSVSGKFTATGISVTDGGMPEYGEESATATVTLTVYGVVAG